MKNSDGIRTTASLSRREIMAIAAAATAGYGAFGNTPARAAIVRTNFTGVAPYGNGTLPAGVRSRHIPNVNG